MIHITFDRETLIVSFGDSQTSILIDDAIYPKSKEIKGILGEMDFANPDKQLANTIRAKEMVWYLYQTLRKHLNRIGNRHPDFPLIEEEYKSVESANLFLFYGIQFLNGKFSEFFTQFSNPLVGRN